MVSGILCLSVGPVELHWTDWSHASLESFFDFFTVQFPAGIFKISNGRFLGEARMVQMGIGNYTRFCEVMCSRNN